MALFPITRVKQYNEKQNQRLAFPTIYGITRSLFYMEVLPEKKLMITRTLQQMSNKSLFDCSWVFYERVLNNLILRLETVFITDQVHIILHILLQMIISCYLKQALLLPNLFIKFKKHKFVLPFNVTSRIFHFQK